RARLAHAGRHRLQVAGAEGLPRAELLPERAGPRSAKQDLLQLAAVRERDVARAVDPAADGAVDLAERDAVAELRDGREARAAGALHVVGRRLGMKPAAQNGFPREVPVARVLDDRPGGHLADALPLQRVPFDQGPEGGR